MPDNPQSAFVHRWNKDRTIDSICTVCFATVCREPTLAAAKQCEDQHRCPGPPPTPPHPRNPGGISGEF